MSRDDNLLPFPERHVDTINGVAMNLGRLSVEELTTLELQCQLRFLAAHTELSTVRNALVSRLSGGRPDGEAS